MQHFHLCYRGDGYWWVLLRNGLKDLHNGHLLLVNQRGSVTNSIDWLLVDIQWTIYTDLENSTQLLIKRCLYHAGTGKQSGSTAKPRWTFQGGNDEFTLLLLLKYLLEHIQSCCSSILRDNMHHVTPLCTPEITNSYVIKTVSKNRHMHSYCNCFLCLLLFQTKSI